MEEVRRGLVKYDTAVDGELVEEASAEAVL